MKYAGGLFLFLAVFAATGVAMHLALFDRPGIFIWTLEEDAATGKAAVVRTVLEVAKVETPEPAADASGSPAKSAEAKPDSKEAASDPKAPAAASASPSKPETAAAPAIPSVPGAKAGDIPLFDGKTLGQWQKTAFGGEGDVFVNESGALEFGFGAVITGVHWGGEPPAKSNYEISLEAMKLDGNDFFLALTFPVKDSHGTFVVGGWGGGIVGISCVDDLSAADNETLTIEGFEKKVWYKIRVRVTDDRLQAWIGEDEKVSLELEGREISLLPGDIELSAPLGIAAYQTRAQYRHIVWRPLPPGE